MILKMFAVLDAKAGFFGQPFFDQSQGGAVRNFADAVNDGSNPNNMWNKHPEDFSLFYLGDFDNSNGQMTPVLPQSIVTAPAVVELKVKEELPLFKKKPPEEIVQ